MTYRPAVLVLCLCGAPLFDGCAKKPAAARILSERVTIREAGERAGRSVRPPAGAVKKPGKKADSRKLRGRAEGAAADESRPVGTAGVSRAMPPAAGDLSTSAPAQGPTRAAAVSSSSEQSGSHLEPRRHGTARGMATWLIAAAAASIVALVMLRHRRSVES